MRVMEGARRERRARRTPFTKSEEKQRLPAVYEQIVEGLNVVNCQPANDLKFNRQPTKKGYFNRQPSKMQINLNYQKGFKVQLFQILLFQLIFTADLIITNLLIYTEGNIYLNAWTKFPLNREIKIHVYAYYEQPPIDVNWIGNLSSSWPPRSEHGLQMYSRFSTWIFTG